MYRFLTSDALNAVQGLCFGSLSFENRREFGSISLNRWCLVRPVVRNAHPAAGGGRRAARRSGRRRHARDDSGSVRRFLPSRRNASASATGRSVGRMAPAAAHATGELHGAPAALHRGGQLPHAGRRRDLRRLSAGRRQRDAAQRRQPQRVLRRGEALRWATWIRRPAAVALLTVGFLPCDAGATRRHRRAASIGRNFGEQGIPNGDHFRERNPRSPLQDLDDLRLHPLVDRLQRILPFSLHGERSEKVSRIRFVDAHRTSIEYLMISDVDQVKVVKALIR